MIRFYYTDSLGYDFQHFPNLPNLKIFTFYHRVKEDRDHGPPPVSHLSPPFLAYMYIIMYKWTTLMMEKCDI